VSALILRLNTIFFVLWIVPLFYGFYKYCKHTEFRKVSWLHYILSTTIVTFSGLLTGMFAIDVGFVLLLFFTDIFITVVQYYFATKTMDVVILLLVYFSVATMFYFLTIRCKNSTVSKVLTSIFLISVFLLGTKGFFYYLARDFRK
jgi:hypothetical protein